MGKVYQVNNSIIFKEKPVGYEEFLNRKVETLGITINRRPKGRSHKRENYATKNNRRILNIFRNIIYK